MSGAQTTGAMHWFDAFPLETAAQAATAICKSWKFLTSRPLHFNGKMTEPRLTKAIKIHVEQATARGRGSSAHVDRRECHWVIVETTGEHVKSAAPT